MPLVFPDPDPIVAGTARAYKQAKLESIYQFHPWVLVRAPVFVEWAPGRWAPVMTTLGPGPLPVAKMEVR